MKNRYGYGWCRYQKEKNSKETEIVSTDKRLKSVAVHETRTRVDLSKYVEKHEFRFDDALDEDVSNDTVFRSTVEALVRLQEKERERERCFS